MNYIYGFVFQIVHNDEKTVIERYIATAITEDGIETVFYEHSDYNELKKFFTTKDKHKKYSTIYPDGYEFKWIDTLDENGNELPITDKGFLDALKKHNEMMDKKS